MATWRCMSVMATTSGLPEDRVVNTWHVNAPSGTPNWADVTDAWEAFMEANRGLFPDTVTKAGHRLKVYNLADEEPRVPVSDLPWEFSTAPTGTSFPAEVALVLSYQGTRVSGTDQARRRGRMYLGPIDTGAMESGRPGPITCAAIPAAFDAFTADLNAAGVYFVVYSRMDEAPVQVVEAWVDNAFDTQRRRGIAPTTRYSESISQVVV